LADATVHSILCRGYTKVVTAGDWQKTSCSCKT